MHTELPQHLRQQSVANLDEAGTVKHELLPLLEGVPYIGGNECAPRLLCLCDGVSLLVNEPPFLPKGVPTLPNGPDGDRRAPAGSLGEVAGAYVGVSWAHW